MKVSAIYEFLNEYAPFSVQDKFDNSGFLVGDMNAPVKGICLCLDITNDVIKEAVANKANLIISHHPVIFDPLKSVTEGMPVYELIKNKLNAVCVHTNADMTKNGVTDIMLDLLEFERSDKILEPVMPEEQQRWYAIKIFERDDKVLAKLDIPQNVIDHIEKDIQAAEKELDDDAESIITNERYIYIASIIKSCYKKKNKGKLTTSDKIDKVVTNRWLGLPIFAVIMFLVYYISM